MPLPFKPCFPDLNQSDPLNEGCSFQPPCREKKYAANGGFGQFNGDCSGRFPVSVSIVDTLRVPKGLPPGEYVLGFRYGKLTRRGHCTRCCNHDLMTCCVRCDKKDCEMTAQ